MNSLLTPCDECEYVVISEDADFTYLKCVKCLKVRKTDA